MMMNIGKLKTICDFVDHAAKSFPQKVALVFENKKYNYRELSKKISAASWVIGKRIKKGDIVGILLQNSADFIISYFGVLGAGGIVLLLPANISDQTLVFQIRKTKPKIIISSDNYLQKLLRTGVLSKIGYFNAKKSFNQLLGIKKLDHKISENDISTIIFTSGTTSEPKGVELRHVNVVSATKNIISFLGLNEKDIDVNISQLSHSFGLGHLHCIFAVGGTSVLFRDSINLKKIIQSIIDNKATTFGAVPAVLRMILDNFYYEFEQCKTLRFIQTNTFTLESSMIRGILKILPQADFCYYYGLTEASRATFINFRKNPEKIGSVGKASPNVDIKIMNCGKEVKPNNIGEISIKGNIVIERYWRNSVASKKIRNNRLFSGDYGYKDEDGFIFFKGRKDDILNIGGEKVSPEEIETIIKKISSIKDVAVVGEADKIFGEVPIAYVSVQNNGFNSQKIKEECSKLLERYKIPRSVVVVDKIPRTENGKLQRNLLKNIN